MENNKHKVIAFALAVAICLSFGANAFAAEPGAMVTQSTDKLEVRVNGHLTQFPDAQPYIDENSRTLIPLRFVTEALGADVSWNQSAKIASVEKSGIRCDITIGSKAMAVTKDGNVDTVMMDTQAVLKDSRTFVPIRYVAEALGAYVDYSNYYKTVGIWQSIFTPEQIEYLQNLPIDYRMHTTDSSDHFIPEYSGEAINGRTENGFESFATAREYVYRNVNTAPVNLKWGGWVPSTEEDSGVLIDKFLQEIPHFLEEDPMYGGAIPGEYGWYTSPALVFQPHTSSNFVIVRGIFSGYTSDGQLLFFVEDIRCGRDQNRGSAHCTYSLVDILGTKDYYFTVEDAPFDVSNLSAN